MDDPVDDSENPLVKLTSLVVLGVGLAALFVGYDRFWLVFALGFAVLVPMVKVVTETLGVDGALERDHQTDPRPRDRATDRPRDRTADRSRNRASDPESKQDALDALRSRYARGDLTEAEFERKVEVLLETETPESARKRVERTGGSAPDAERHETEASESRTRHAETETDQ